MSSYKNLTIIISCAGKGTRLGKGCTKALIEINEKPLIIHQLELLNECDDIRIIVGYQAEKVIETVKRYRDDVQFIYNHDYETTGTAASFSKGLPDSREYVIALDGDLLVNPNDMKMFLEYKGECVGGCIPTTDDPVLMTISEDRKIIEFSREHGELEWTGLAKLKADRLVPGTHHVYMMIEPLMPIDVIEIRTKEIDTENDYNNAIKWVNNGYCEIHD